LTPKKQIEKNTVGKPLKFTIEDVENIISQYFDETPESEYTVTVYSDSGVSSKY